MTSGYIGQQFGNYRLNRLLGQGGFADVYLGEHMYLRTQAAIKVLHMQLAHNEQEKFLAEARTIARLEHPHIISVLEFGIEKETPYLVMDYAAHGALRQRYPRGARLEPAQIVYYAKQVALALQYVHDRHLVHRDIKPENMLLGRNNDILLSDFGIALVVQQAYTAESSLRVVGTIAYMAPEQLRGNPLPASDQYALAAVIYEWLCGQPPFQGSFTEVAIQHALVPPPPLHERLPGIAPALEEVVMHALAKDPRQRFATIQAFAHALEQASLPIGPGVSRRASEGETGQPSTQSHRGPSRRAITAGIIGAVGLAVAGGAAWEVLSGKWRELLPGGTPAPASGTTLFTYHGHSSPVAAVAWSPDSTRIASAGDNVQVWDATTGRHVYIYRGHSAPANNQSTLNTSELVVVNAVAWSPDGKYIASGGGLYTPGPDYSVHVWEAATGKTVNIYRGHTAAVTGLAWSPDGKYIASASDDQTVYVWEALTGRRLVVHHEPAEQSALVGPDTVAWSPDGKFIVSGGGNTYSTDTGSFKQPQQVWDAASGRIVLSYQAFSSQVTAVAWSPDGKRIASGGGATYYSPTSDYSVRIWSAASGRTLLTYRGHSSPITSLAWSPDGRYIVSGSTFNSPGSSGDRTAQIWDVATGRILLTYRGHTRDNYDGVTAVAWSPDGKRIASGGTDTTVQVWVAW